MKIISMQRYAEYGDVQHKNFKVIPINEYDEKEMADESVAFYRNLYIDMDFSGLFYFLAVAIMVIVIFSSVFFLVYWNRIKSKMIVISHLLLNAIQK